jgi:hypothetical protein
MLSGLQTVTPNCLDPAGGRVCHRVGQHGCVHECHTRYSRRFDHGRRDDRCRRHGLDGRARRHDRGGERDRDYVVARRLG